jgi:glycosyltransferase involved in cell wall biosynthesis
MRPAQAAVNRGGRIDSRPLPELLADDPGSCKPLLSVIVPAYNEAAILQENLATLCDYLTSIEGEYQWEILLVNDGSTDNTGDLADEFAGKRENVHVLHHLTNFGMGQALQFALNHSRGEYVLVLDLDLSYSTDHIGHLLRKIREGRAKVVIASPYMNGGRVSNVPWLRKTLSVWANRFLSRVAKGDLTTLTGMVRAYDGEFVRTLNLRSTGMEINPEIIYKAKLLQARIDEIPAHLNWQPHKPVAAKRRSSMRMMRHTMATIISGFIFRPFLLFTLPGLILLLFSLWVNAWMVIHWFGQLKNFPQDTWFLARASDALAAAYHQFPHTFIVGLLSMILAIQLIGLGILSFQSKHYFEEIFHLGTNLNKTVKKERLTDHD